MLTSEVLRTFKDSISPDWLASVVITSLNENVNYFPFAMAIATSTVFEKNTNFAVEREFLDDSRCKERQISIASGEKTKALEKLVQISIGKGDVDPKEID